jgi:hypothetical protein
MIELSNKAKQYMKMVFSRYEYSENIPDEFYGRTILHLYPKRDTMRDNEEHLLGFEDGLLFDVHIYSIDNKKKYIITNKDQIEISFPVMIRIFKDQSTMIIIDRAFKLGRYQSLELNSLNRRIDDVRLG